MLSDRAPAATSALILKLPQALGEARLLPVHRPDFFQHPGLRIVEALDDRAHNPHIVAQAGNVRDQPLQSLADEGQVNHGLASIFAHDGISFSTAILSSTPRSDK
jgi:hypothetical protein